MKILLFSLLASLCFAQQTAVDVVNVRILRQLGAPVPPSTTDHIRVTVTDLDPATVKVVIHLTYFDGGDEVKVERTVSRNEVGATYSHWIKDASTITGPSATVTELIAIESGVQ